MNGLPIITERFVLRQMTLSDTSGIYELDSDPDVNKYIGNQPISTLQEAKERIQDVMEQYKQYGMGRLVIEDKVTNEFIGWTGIKYETRVRSYPYYDIGYRLIPRYWGKGIGTETAIASLEYGFNVLKLQKICGAADIDNVGSNKILSKIGLKLTEQFTFEGILHNWYENSKVLEKSS